MKELGFAFLKQQRYQISKVFKARKPFMNVVFFVVNCHMNFISLESVNGNDFMGKGCLFKNEKR